MTRRHFQAIADVLARHADVIPAETLWDLADDLADVCAAENPRFDRQRFRTACGLDAWQRPRLQDSGKGVA